MMMMMMMMMMMIIVSVEQRPGWAANVYTLVIKRESPYVGSNHQLFGVIVGDIVGNKLPKGLNHNLWF